MTYATQWASFLFTAKCHTQILKFGSASNILHFVFSTSWNIPKSSFNVNFFFFFASVTSPGTASFFLSQPQSSLLWISAHSLSSFTCVASLLNDCMSTPHDRYFFYHSTCFVSLLHFPFGWAVWWLVLIKCDMGLPLGKKEAMNYTLSAWWN